MQVEVSPDADGAAGRAAELVADVARRAVRDRGARPVDEVDHR
jgi:hypothetical protein